MLSREGQTGEAGCGHAETGSAPIPPGAGTAVTRCRSRAGGRSSRSGRAAVLHLGLASLNLEPSRLTLRRCSPLWHCTGGFPRWSGGGLSIPPPELHPHPDRPASLACSPEHLQGASPSNAPSAVPGGAATWSKPCENREGEKQAGKRESSKV